MTLSDKDIEYIKNNASTVEKVKAQIELIKKGVAYSNLKRVASIGDGILKMNPEQKTHYIDVFEKRRDSLSLVKFVPASGAATRMFKFLFNFLKKYNIEEGSINSYINKFKDNDIKVFIVGLEKLPFFEEVVHKIHEILPNFNDLNYDEKRLEFIKTMLDEDRLNYSAYPKGLLPFHRYKEHVATAFEEHLFEAAMYASSNKKAHLHFTISEEHAHNFDKEFRFIEEDVEDRTNTKFNISFSYQRKYTETIALTDNNELCRKNDGTILFRPAGHGALLENLNELKYDLVFIKNIDNVTVLKLNEESSSYKKMLAGILLEVQEKVFQFLLQLENEDFSEDGLNIIVDFLSENLNIVMSSEYHRYSKKFKIDYIKDKLNRPIRVCGMVKNEGEPGGGPFWVLDDRGKMSLQIVEFAQIDMKNPAQKELVSCAQYFNPTDMVCSFKDYKGQWFNLEEFVDEKAVFVTSKTYNGEHIQTLELPGLWNGSMAYWNSIFVEIPLLTFNPVKTVNDLLKAPHQVTSNVQ